MQNTDFGDSIEKEKTKIFSVKTQVGKEQNAADLVNSSSGNSILYMPGYFSPSSVYRTFASAKLVHVISSNTFYEVKAQHKINRYTSG